MSAAENPAREPDPMRERIERDKANPSTPLADDETREDAEREGLVVHDPSNSPGADHVPTEPFVKPE